MRVLVAPDKFKGSLSATEAGEAIAAGVAAALPDAEVVVVPVADGGEGTVEVALRAGAVEQRTRVLGPLTAEVEASWARFDDGRAVIETAAACGLGLVAPTPATAVLTHSFGAGQLVVAALDAGCRRVVLGVGGSAMTDGGSGALQALGARLRDDQGQPVPLGGGALGDVAVLDLADLDPRLAEATIEIAVDVDSPLTGPDGAAQVFGPQKGADPRTCDALDRALVHWADVVHDTTGRAVDVPGAGAAGGLPAAFLACSPARLVPGFDLLADLVALPTAVAAADLVLTGEGSLDAQSLRGKAPVRVAELARDAGVPALAVAGAVTVDAAELRRHGVLDHAALLALAPGGDAAVADAAHWAEVAATDVVRRWSSAQPSS